MVAAATLQRLGRRHECCVGPHVLQTAVFPCVVATHSRRAIHEAKSFPSHRNIDLHVRCFQHAVPGASVHTECLNRMDVAPSADRVAKNYIAWHTWMHDDIKTHMSKNWSMCR